MDTAPIILNMGLGLTNKRAAFATMSRLTDDMLRIFRGNDVLRAKCELGTRIEHKYSSIFPARPNALHFRRIPKEA